MNLGPKTGGSYKDEDMRGIGKQRKQREEEEWVGKRARARGVMMARDKACAWMHAQNKE